MSGLKTNLKDLGSAFEKIKSVNKVNEMLSAFNIPPLSDQDVRDWDIRGGESEDELREWVNDYVS